MAKSGVILKVNKLNSPLHGHLFIYLPLLLFCSGFNWNRMGRRMRHRGEREESKIDGLVVDFLG